MPSLPRIITVDPTGNIARIVRATIDLSEYACRQIDVPTAEEALEEMKLGGGHLVVMALDLEDMSSIMLAEELHALGDNLAVILLAEEADPLMEVSEQQERGIVYMRRPVDIQEFSQVIFAAMRGTDVFEARRKALSTGSDNNTESYGSVPAMDADRAGTIVDQLLIDLGAMAIFLMGRDGTMILERGADSFLDRDALVSALIPSIHSTIDMRELVGGDATVLQFYDGDRRDVYTLSVGLHHMLLIAYDGEKGQREFGMVNRLGRKAAMDMIALLGAEAFMLRRRMPEAEPQDDLPRRTIAVSRVQVEEDEPIHLERATEFISEAPAVEKVEMAAIEDFDESLLDQLENIDLSEADALFDLDNFSADLNVKTSKTITDEEARQLGILGD